MTRETALDIHRGMWFWVKGWSHLLRNRRLLLAATLPILISSSAAVSLIWVLWNRLPHWVQSQITWIGLHSGWLREALYYPILVSLALLVLFSSVYVMYLAQSLIAVPFYSYLADATLIQLAKKPEKTRTWREWRKHTFRMIRVALLKFLLLLAVGCVLFVFSFLPILNIFTLSCALLLLALDCMDYSLDAFSLGFRARLAYYSRNWAQWFGMAFGLGLTLLVPGLTLLIIPGAVVGAAIIVKSESL
jgi:uncharacterized protein involved in cysteine biosynthesis